MRVSLGRHNYIKERVCNRFANNGKARNSAETGGAAIITKENKESLSVIEARTVIKYPLSMRFPRSYTLTCDLEPLSTNWPHHEEEYPVYFSPLTNKALKYRFISSANTVLLHKFGGTYGPVLFLIWPTVNEGMGEISFLLENKHSVQVHQTSIIEIPIIGQDVIDVAAKLV